MTITSFTRKNIPNLRKDIEAALKAVGEKHGIDLTTGNARFSDSNVTFKLEASVVGENGEVITKEAKALSLYYPEFVNKKVTVNGKPGVVIGYNTRARKNCWVVKVGSQTYVCPDRVVGK